MFIGIDTPTRVVGVYEDHCGCVLVSNRLERVDIDFPTSFRNQIKMANF
uniref:Naat1 n=1 Tax=Arundo donax TaxID=35708 RepID=A0A0A8ZT36_ARUDO